MLDYAHRFHGLNGLNFVHRQGRAVRGAQVSLKYAVNQRRQTYRVAVVVSKKVAKSAVVRNRIRRRIYEIVRQEAETIARPYDLVIAVYAAGLAELEAAELRRQIGGLLKKAGVTKPAPRAIVKPEE